MRPLALLISFSTGAFDLSKFVSDPLHPVAAAAPFGSAGLIVVGNSRRFFEPATPQSLDVIDAAQPLAGAASAAIVRTVPAGAFPRARPEVSYP